MEFAFLRLQRLLEKQVVEHKRNHSSLLADGCQEKSVPLSFITFVSMIIGGKSITDHISCAGSKASLNIAQSITFNLVKQKRRQTSLTEIVRHPVKQETPFPLYLSLLLHSRIRKRGLVDTIIKNGLGVSYDRVQAVELSLTKQLCKKYNEEGLVCPPSLKCGRPQSIIKYIERIFSWNKHFILSTSRNKRGNRERRDSHHCGKRDKA